MQTFGSLTITETGMFAGENLGKVRQFVAAGKRGAQYGCLVYEDGRFQWINLRNRSYASVPFDLAQYNPITQATRYGHPAVSTS